VRTPAIPPTAVGGWFKSCLHKGAPRIPVFLFSLPRGARREKTGEDAGPCCRPCLNDPPTPVGGIAGVFTQPLRWWDSKARDVLACRPRMNEPPTAVGGIIGTRLGRGPFWLFQQPARDLQRPRPWAGAAILAGFAPDELNPDGKPQLAAAAPFNGTSATRLVSRQRTLGPERRIEARAQDQLYACNVLAVARARAIVVGFELRFK